MNNQKLYLALKNVKANFSILPFSKLFNIINYYNFKTIQAHIQTPATEHMKLVLLLHPVYNINVVDLSKGYVVSFHRDNDTMNFNNIILPLILTNNYCRKIYN